jgi:hypothetical protein
MSPLNKAISFSDEMRSPAPNLFHRWEKPAIWHSRASGVPIKVDRARASTRLIDVQTRPINRIFAGAIAFEIGYVDRRVASQARRRQ